MTDTQMPTAYRFIEPLDLLFLRGNALFGDAGSYGPSMVLPRPSVLAGALRSLMLVHDGFDPAEFARGQRPHPTLGTPSQPGSFALTGLDLARRRPDGSVESLHALPADLVLSEGQDGQPQLQQMRPHAPAAGLQSSAPLSHWPLLAQPQRSKPIGGRWLTQAGWAQYLNGQTPGLDQLVSTDQLWQMDSRVGIGLDAATGSVAEGKLFSAQALALRSGIGYLASVQGGEPPASGLLRLGGDGRGAAIQAVRHAPPEPPWQALADARSCRIVLTTPGLFAQGWLPPGLDAQHWLSLHGITGRLVCATVPRAEVISGWDLALRQPKPAERAASSGSVYWIDDLEATPAQLRKLAGHGLWDDDNQNPARRAEGFNRFSLAAY